MMLKYIMKVCHIKSYKCKREIGNKKKVKR